MKCDRSRTGTRQLQEKYTGEKDKERGRERETGCQNRLKVFYFILFYSYSDLAGEPCRTSRYMLFFPRKPLKE